ncbi:hypothetical protein DFP74_5769 [Nocardiopsis sp. Huas11]|uniref:hypothetical protein n=1 Tax=Nocardiopsis sp. Huas11 TaxID=2183912 RepID=UPI000EB2CF85|nr:hypothetical protein [Nocardiopsis sp. Huas11]RKS10023.1 hypothetical protein DFP74_5769 [Nocardiopsis sp. Huas11]
MRHQQINVFLAVLVGLLAAGMAIADGTAPLLLGLFAASCGFLALVGADSWRRHRASIRGRIRRMTKPRTAARRSRKGGRK